MAEQEKARAKGADSEEDLRQSPLGFFNLGLAYLDAADKLAAELASESSSFRLGFDHPVRHLYAHAWELCLKACLFRQGVLPSVLRRKRFGHSLLSLWDCIDREQFAALQLADDVRQLLEVLEQFHPTKLYAYPVVGIRRDFSLTFIRAASRRLRLDRGQIVALFGAA